MEKIILRGHPQDSEKNFPCVGKTKMWSSMLAKRFASAKNSGRDYGFKTILENRIMPKKNKKYPSTFASIQILVYCETRTREFLLYSVLLLQKAPTKNGVRSLRLRKLHPKRTLHPIIDIVQKL